MSRSNNWPSRYFMNTRLDYLWEKVSLFTQFSDLAKIFEPIFFKISLKTGPIFDHPLLVKIGSEIRKSVQNRKTDIFSSPAVRPIRTSIHTSVPIRVLAITPKLYGIYLWNFTGACMTLRQCVMNKEDNLGCLVFELSALDLVPYSKLCLGHTPKPYGIYLWNFTGVCMTLRRCVMKKEDNSCLFGFLIICPWLSSV